MNSFNKLERNYRFELERGIGYQHNKILSEVKEVEDEVVFLPEAEGLYFKTTLTNYVNELQDIIMACNNQLLRMEDKYGADFLRRAMTSWDKKMEYYKDVKYK